MNKNIDENKLEFSTHPPQWINSNAIENMDEDILTIIEFFVVNTPCKDTSARSIPLSKYGWESNNYSPKGYLYNRLLDVAKLIKNENLFTGEKREDMKETFAKAEMGKNFYNEYKENQVAVLKNGNLLNSIFKAIRNSLAHCRFIIVPIKNDSLLIMENGSIRGDRIEIKARLILRKSTLLEWIEIIKTEAEILKKREELRRKEIEAKVFKAISEDTIQSLDKLAVHIGFEKKHIEEAIKKLKDENAVEYSRSKRQWICKIDSELISA